MKVRCLSLKEAKLVRYYMTDYPVNKEPKIGYIAYDTMGLFGNNLFN